MYSYERVQYEILTIKINKNYPPSAACIIYYFQLNVITHIIYVLINIYFYFSLFLVLNKVFFLKTSHYSLISTNNNIHSYLNLMCLLIFFAGWRGNIKETIAKGWWSLNTERTDKDLAADSGEQRPRSPDEEVNLWPNGT